MKEAYVRRKSLTIVSISSASYWLTRIDRENLYTAVMTEIILYPTETLYGLGVNAFSETDWNQLCTLKGRSEKQTASWLVRSLDDIDRLAVLTKQARYLANSYLPGPLTLVLHAREAVPHYCRAVDGTVSFRISSDSVAKNLIHDYMEKSGGIPLTSTSANLHGQKTFSTVTEILDQFGEKRKMITRVYDDGPRAGCASTVVRCVDEEVVVLRQGIIRID